MAKSGAAQVRTDRHAINRERTAAAAAATAEAAFIVPPEYHHHTNGGVLFRESEGVQRLNKVWARQEMPRVKSRLYDAKIHDGVKYERKATGSFMGKLVSQGTIIHIDGEEYVEYRVLTKPSFF
ncbi:hypothetical protein MAA_10574 [Metarhizium robertsii ARSEF 23]|nr:uncharacterized protein MAA_10574 [Metarhizium robertsii ARSEF 23]EFY93965.1 hypothetical protein MAA_10574 [Metarhizium robertsii ARSEF 23]